MITVSYKPLVAGEDPWGRVIESFIAGEFPQAHKHTESRLDAVMEAFLSTRQRRLGPVPGVEAQAEMRKVIRHYIEAKLPIPVLIPFGPKKPRQGEGIDVAELAALKALGCLQRSVVPHHEPGMHFLFRMEDLTGKVLEEGTPKLLEDIDGYCRDFKQLSEILGYSEFMEVVKETELGNQDTFLAEMAKVQPVMETYLTESWNSESPADCTSYQPLKELGFVGMVSPAQREFYMDRYSRLYPELTTDQRVTLLAKYLACSLVRRNLGMTGARKEWNGRCLSLSFAPPAPDQANTAAARVYYRTVPLDHSKSHMPPWRAKGVLKCSDDKIRFSLLPWQEVNSAALFSGMLIVQSGKHWVPIRADYLLD
jgi:hypothetical protein